ncbi:branched-chain amino acid ABC transporter permease [Novosphingobium kaempferiae]|uniref:branched-chain amino acid ABC transporter permease n=1 Tax=Novosphingobium kaempferiae TaxID=2896849 RepID=UPI001E35FC8C|nr:branched-chain amino acid ABC transporter permease [Novosphingobium kaempferiae]
MDILPALLTGIALGSIYGLIALGFHITASVCGAVNFAQGSSAMLGAVLLWMLAQAGWPVPIAVGGAVLTCGAYGLIVEHAAIRPFLARKSDAWLMATVALGLVCDNGMMLIFGAEPRSLASPLTLSSIRLGGMDLGIYPLHLLIPIVMLALATGIDLFRLRTLHGVAMLGVAQNRDAAAIMGIPVGRVIAAAFALSSALAGIAGMLVAPLSHVETGMGVVLGLKAFAVAILGGLGSAWGIVFAALLFGLVEALVTLGIGSGFTQIVTFMLVIVVLAVRPDGLLGRAQVRKV